MDDWFLAARENNAELLLSRSAECSGVFNDKGATALMVAAAQGNLEAVALLAETEVAVTRPTGWTALMEAAYHGQARAVRLLALDLAGKQLVEEDGIFSRGSTALIIAATLGHSECVSVLLEYEKEASHWTNEFIQLFKGQETILAAVHDNAGHTPLMYYAMHAHKGLFALNLHRNAESKLSAGRLDFAGYSALMHAVRTDNTEFIAYVLSECLPELRIVSPRSQMYSALMMAAELGNLEASELLASEETGLANPYGLCALDIAIIHGHYDIVLLLAPTESHITIHKECICVHTLEPGMTPADIAAKYGSPEMLSILSQRNKQSLALSSLIADAGSAHPDSLTLLRSGISLSSRRTRIGDGDRLSQEHGASTINHKALLSERDEYEDIEELREKVLGLREVNAELRKKLKQIDDEHGRAKDDLNRLAISLQKQEEEHARRESALKEALQATKDKLERSADYSQEIFQENNNLRQKLEHARGALVALRDERQQISSHDTALLAEHTLLLKELHQLEWTASGLQSKESILLALIQRFTSFYNELTRVVKVSTPHSPQQTGYHPQAKEEQIDWDTTLPQMISDLVNDSFDEATAPLTRDTSVRLKRNSECSMYNETISDCSGCPPETETRS